MARKAKAKSVGSFPPADKLPAGISILTIQPKVYPTRRKDETSSDYQARRKTEGRKTTVEVYQVDNAVGLKNVPGFISEAAGGDGETGIRAGIAAWNLYLAGVAKAVTLDTVARSLSLIPPIPNVKTVDPTEAAIDGVRDAWRAAKVAGKPLSMEQLQKMFEDQVK
jgi:hypothetical protein